MEKLPPPQSPNEPEVVQNIQSGCRTELQRAAIGGLIAGSLFTVGGQLLANYLYVQTQGSVDFRDWILAGGLTSCCTSAMIIFGMGTLLPRLPR